jgi:hypothetical protein
MSVRAMHVVRLKASYQRNYRASISIGHRRDLTWVLASLQMSLSGWDSQVPTIILFEGGKEQRRLPHTAVTASNKTRMTRVRVPMHSLLQIRLFPTFAIALVSKTMDSYLVLHDTHVKQHVL